jgi:hypothetical protein
MCACPCKNRKKNQLAKVQAESTPETEIQLASLSIQEQPEQDLSNQVQSSNPQTQGNRASWAIKNRNLLA